MNTFLSWSGAKSHAVALAFADWIPTVLNGVKPWISSKDIDKGATWITAIKQALNDSQGIGIFFVTRDNHASSWLLFEAGSIASLGHERVCVVYVDIEPSELQPPLSLFQGTKLEKQDVFALLKTLNKSLKEPVADKVLDTCLERGWQDLDGAVKRALSSSTDRSHKRAKKPATEDILADISSAVQRIESRLSTLETQHSNAAHWLMPPETQRQISKQAKASSNSVTVDELVRALRQQDAEKKGTAWERFATKPAVLSELAEKTWRKIDHDGSPQESDQDPEGT